MAIPSYEFYKNRYYGISVPKDDWDRIATRADEQLSYFERIYVVTDPTENGKGRDMAVCAIADQIYVYEVVAASELSVDQSGNVSSSSVSIGSVSTSSKSPNISTLGLDMTESGQQKQYYRLAEKYLYIYRGVPHGFCH